MGKMKTADCLDYLLLVHSLFLSLRIFLNYVEPTYQNLIK